MTHKKPSQGPHGQKTVNPSPSTSINYISLGMKRFKELSVPVIAIINSLNPSQRLFVIVVVSGLLFWPLLILAINLPWMLTAVAIGYVALFGLNKFIDDVKDASDEHLKVNVDEKCAQISKKFESSEFPGKDTLIYMTAQGKGIALGLYRSGLVIAISMLDLFVTFLLDFARFIKSALMTTSPATSTQVKTTAFPVQEQQETKQD